MDNECDCSSRTRGVNKAPIPIGDYDISLNPTLSASIFRKCTHCQKTEVIPSPKQSKSSTTSKASYFQCNESDHHYSDLDLTCIPFPSSYHRSLHLHKKHTLWAETITIPRRTSSLAFESSLKNMEEVCSASWYLSASPETLDSSRSSSRLDLSGKRLEYVQKVLEDLQTWHNEVSMSISRSRSSTHQNFHHNNFDIVPTQVHKQQTHHIISSFIGPLQQDVSWTQVFSGDCTTSRRYTSRSLCPESNRSTLWKIDLVPTSIYKSKRMQTTGIRRSPRPVPSPRTSSLGATILPKRRNAIRGRIFPEPVSIVYPTMKKHSCQPQATVNDSCNSDLDRCFGSYWDGEGSLADTQDHGGIDEIDSSPAGSAQTNHIFHAPDQSYEDIGGQDYRDGIPHSGTVVWLSARNSSLQASESTFKRPLQENEEEKARRHIAYVHSALRNLVPFEISNYLYRISQLSETCHNAGETFSNSFSDMASPYIKSNSTFQSSKTSGQNGDSAPGSSFSFTRTSNYHSPLRSPDAIDDSGAWAPGTAV
ncbi:hypothetical protein EAE96_004703 [Botrytis aclada]|nr:hypothetical protein EAE96_004703 [Botrytis aclada]